MIFIEIYFNNELCYKTQYEGYYVTISGKIITIKIKGGQGKLNPNNPREHSYKIDKDGYLECCLSINGKHIYKRVHRLVYETLKGPILNDLTIDHIDKNPKNNHIDNLRLMTRSQNTSIARKNQKSNRRYMYMVNGELLDRQQVQQKYNIKSSFWYSNKNKIDEKNYKIDNIILYRV